MVSQPATEAPTTKDAENFLKKNLRHEANGFGRFQFLTRSSDEDTEISGIVIGDKLENIVGSYQNLSKPPIFHMNHRISARSISNRRCSSASALETRDLVK